MADSQEMHPDDVVAIHQSVEKWQEIAVGHMTDAGRENCPLCARFGDICMRPSEDGAPTICPVFQQSGQPGCKGTPYEAFHLTSIREGTIGEASTPELQQLALDEAAYLRGLLPEEVQYALPEDAEAYLRSLDPGLPKNFRIGTLQTLFDLLTTTARAKARCPQQSDLRDLHGISGTYKPMMLADLGLIKIEIYSLNWRVIEIMSGPFKGERTMEPQRDGAPYKVYFNKRRAS